MGIQPTYHLEHSSDAWRYLNGSRELVEVTTVRADLGTHMGRFSINVRIAWGVKGEPGSRGRRNVCHKLLIASPGSIYWQETGRLWQAYWNWPTRSWSFDGQLVQSPRRQWTRSMQHRVKSPRRDVCLAQVFDWQHRRLENCLGHIL